MGHTNLTREIPGDNLIEDRPGRYIFIRDNDTGEFWSLNYQPVRRPLDHFEARHGLGYTTLQSSCQGVDGSINYFVPDDDTCEIWQVKLGNTGSAKKRLSVFAFVEWELGEDLHNSLFFRDNAIFAVDRKWQSGTKATQPWDKVSFMTMDHAVDSYDCDKEKFLGMYGSLGSPRAVVDGKCSRSSGSGHRPVGVLQRNITLGGKAQANFNVILGAGLISPLAKSFPQALLSGVRQSQRMIAKYKKVGAAEKAFVAMKKRLDVERQTILASSPDTQFNHLFNYWTKQQISASVSNGKEPISLSNLSQDILGLLPGSSVSPGIIKEIIETQLKDGQFYSLGKKTQDSSQWLATLIIFYLKEIGIAALKEQYSYYDGSSASLLEHLVRAMEHSLKNLSDRHLPFSGVREHDRTESTVEACHLCYNLREIRPILEAAGEHMLREKYEHRYEKIKESINKHLWDGGWYLQSLKGHEKTGSKSNPYHRIDLDAQTWPVISGVADSTRSTKAMDAVWKYLNSPNGPATLCPAYIQPDEKYGLVSQLPPGIGINGGISTRSTVWAIIAETILERGDQAYKLYQETSPSDLSNDQEKYQTEPYAYAEFITGTENPQPGKGENAWAATSAAWFYRASLDYILGIQPVLAGLKIDPCLPRDWRQVEISRKFRGAEYNIRIVNPLRQTKGIDRILVDGIRLTGSVIPASSGGSHFVEVFLG